MTERKDLMDLEGALWDALNMAEIAADHVTALHSQRTSKGFLIDEDSMRLLAFATMHTLTLVRNAKSEWSDAVDASRKPERKG
ncbi:hypothetical protein ABMA32_22285 [Mesorhizobium sp. VNQ89]|uniref:hypothetical protein n=1 Tax=Mesorhizobium quangtriensis TaxID=3157709 RepID=UPI0032B7B83F